MLRAIDLHVHSNYSDGSDSVFELVDKAAKINLAAFALTDHDTTAGVEESIRYAQELREQGNPNIPEIIPGIELSTEYLGKDIHILGLYIDHRSQAFQDHLQQFTESRLQRNLKMCANLRAAGIDISYESLQKFYPDSVITRSHYASYLVHHKYSLSREDAFSQYLGDHSKYFVPREKISPVDGINFIHSVGGIASLAHPYTYKLSNQKLENLVSSLAAAKLDAIEAVYSTHSPSEERQLRSLAHKYKLAITGGSDYHGLAKPKITLGRGFGKLYVPESILETLNPYNN